jgi:hypothetical protein
MLLTRAISRYPVSGSTPDVSGMCENATTGIAVRSAATSRVSHTVRDCRRLEVRGRDRLAASVHGAREQAHQRAHRVMPALPPGEVAIRVLEQERIPAVLPPEGVATDLTMIEVIFGTLVIGLSWPGSPSYARIASGTASVAPVSTSDGAAHVECRESRIG